MCYRLMICAGFLALLAGCGGSRNLPTAPSSLPIDGTYVGTLTDSVYGSGSMRVTLTSSGSTVSGTWSTTFPNPSANNSGTTLGTFNGGTLAATMRPSSAGCTFAMTATRIGAQLSGTYVANTCGVAGSGSINLTKQ